MPRQRAAGDWPLCREPSAVHALVVCYYQVGQDYFLFCGQESSWLKMGGNDKFDPKVIPIPKNPLLNTSHCTHVVLRHCERTRAGSGPIGSLSQGYTAQLPNPDPKTKSLWGFPKGGSQRKEGYPDCALREVWEETDNTLDLAKLKDPALTPTAKYMSGSTPGLAFFYELTPAEANAFLCRYAILNLRREGELFHGDFYSLSYLYNTLMPVMNSISRDAFLQFLALKNIQTPVPGGSLSRNRKRQTRRSKRKTG